MKKLTLRQVKELMSVHPAAEKFPKTNPGISYAAKQAGFLIIENNPHHLYYEESGLKEWMDSYNEMRMANIADKYNIPKYSVNYAILRLKIEPKIIGGRKVYDSDQINQIIQKCKSNKNV